MPRAFSDDERAVILDRLHSTALEVLGQPGLKRTSVATLAKAAGISKGGFYLFYESKEQLAISLLRQAEADLRKRLDDALEAPDPLADLLEVLLLQAPRHPILALLSDPDELLWLTRSLPEGQLEAERAADRAWFRRYLERLRAVRSVSDALTPEILLGLAGSGLALAHGAPLMNGTEPTVRRLLVDALYAHFSR